MESSTRSRHPESLDPARLYELLVEQLPDFAIFMTDPDGIITTWNKGVEYNLGYPRDAFVGHDVAMIFTPEDRAAGVPQQEREKATRDRSAPDERWHLRMNGTRLFVEGVMCAVRDKNGELLGFSKVIRDATRRKRAEEALERSNQDLSEFAYMVSHDLQAPLRAVSIYSELLAQTHRPETDTAEFLRIIQDGAAQMQRLIQDLLNLARSSAIRPVPVLVDLDEALEQAIRNQQVLIEETQARITHDRLPVVLGDEPHFVQVFQNLVGNALKYRSAEPPRIHVTAQNGGAKWRISVEDNGVGVPEDQRRRIFEPFRRLHGSAYPGSGIGLAIVKKIIERYGGEVWVDPAPGGGSIFSFTLEKENGAGSYPAPHS